MKKLQVNMGSATEVAGLVASLLMGLDHKSITDSHDEFIAMTGDKPEITEAGEHACRALLMVAKFAKEFQEAGFSKSKNDKYGETTPLFEFKDGKKD